MTLLAQNIKWDAYLIYKYGIVAVASAITAIYCVSFLFVDTTGLEKWVAVLIFTDPVMYGFLFTAIMVLFEKDAQTHQVLAVTPLPTNYFIVSKAIVFTGLSGLCGLAIILSAQPYYFNIIWFILAIVLSSVLFVFIGIIGVSYVQNFNQFILIMPLVMGPVCLPFLHYFSLAHSWVFYLIPTQACLILFSASVSPTEAWQIVYALIYLLICNVFAYKWAIKSFNKRILKTNRNE
jgi:fluoroquinolone transport system permease protein